jgi:hypothetical protein
MDKDNITKGNSGTIQSSSNQGIEWSKRRVRK